MKKILLILLVNVSCYGNTIVKEGFFKKICKCLCPCFYKQPRSNYWHTNSSLKRIKKSENLKHMESQSSPVDFKLKVYESNPITDEMKEYVKQNRSEFNAPVNE